MFQRIKKAPLIAGLQLLTVCALSVFTITHSFFVYLVINMVERFYVFRPYVPHEPHFSIGLHYFGFLKYCFAFGVGV